MQLVSVIMPYYKKKAYIKDSIRSVLKQTYQNFEIIIVYDDTDKSDLEFIRQIISRDSRIRLLVNKNNSGAGFSRNKGIENANGNFIAFLDCDDLWKERKLETQIKFMNEKKVFFTFTAYEILDKKKLKNDIRLARNSINFDELLRSCDIGLSTVILKKKLINKNCNFPRIKTKEDFVLWLKIAQTKIDLRGINESLTIWRKLDSSLSSKFFQKIFDGFSVYNKYMKFNFFKSIYYLLILSFSYLKKEKIF
tara:strand:- start:487 stop:1239 length:753 start_codon:yes stop_codon:yes gene_type:complete